MHPSLFKAFSSVCYWLWVICHMGKHTLILKGSANHSAILAAMVRVLLRLPSLYLVLYCAVSLCGNAILLDLLYLGCMRRLITLQYKG